MSVNTSDYKHKRKRLPTDHKKMASNMHTHTTNDQNMFSSNQFSQNTLGFGYPFVIQNSLKAQRTIEQID